MVAPPNNSLLGLPVKFQWTPRSGLSTDSYQFAIFDFTDGNPFAQTAPLGYVGSATINALPGTFQSNVPYAWEVLVNSPDGGQGTSFGTRFIAFTNAASAAAVDRDSGGAQLVPGLARPDGPPR